LVFGMRLNALDWVNFFLADVRGGPGAYVNVFLLTKAQWSPTAIGAVLSTSGLVGIIGATSGRRLFIDRTRAEQALIVFRVLRFFVGLRLAIVSLPFLSCL